MTNSKYLFCIAIQSVKNDFTKIIISNLGLNLNFYKYETEKNFFQKYGNGKETFCR